MKNYDVLIIGAGGGTKISSACIRLGEKVAIVEKSKPGGTCLNRGCIPSKMLIHPSHQVKNINSIDRLKINAKVESVDFAELVKSINAHTDGMSGGIDRSYTDNEKIDYYKGHATFIEDKVVEVNGEKLTADKIIIATGSRAMIPNIKGLAHTPFMTSNEALRNKKLPKSMIVLGGGYIATELGGAYAGYGTDVSFVVRSSFLKREDKEIIDIFDKEFSKGKNIYANSQVLEASYKDKKFKVKISCNNEEQELEAEELLVCTGIVPNSDKIGLENTSIKTKQGDFIDVNEYLETSVKGVYAIGDVAGNFLFRHSVNFEGEYWVEENILNEKASPINYPPVPSAVFTHPEIASVGITEEQAKKDGINYIIGTGNFSSIAMGRARGLEEGLVKLIFDKETSVLLGAHIIGEEASTLIQELILALTHKMTAQDIYRQIYIHPAFPEVIRNAVRMALKQIDSKFKILF